MPTSLTDQMFQDGKPKSLTDQMFEGSGGVSLTDQMFALPSQPAQVEEPVVEPTAEPEEPKTPSIFDIGMEAALGRSVEEYDEMKSNPIVTDRFKQEITETLSGYLDLAKNPMEIVRGGAEFVMSLPGFGLGILAAGQKMLERMGRPFDLSELYDAASDGMNESMEMWSKNMVEPLLGPPTPESQLVGSTAMAPALALSALGKAVAESESFKDYPNVRGLSKFAGDIGGLVALGRIYKGSKAEVTAKAEEIVRRAEQVTKREKLLSMTPDEAVKAVQQKILDMEKKQLELESIEVQKNLDYGKMIEEDLGSKRTQIKKAKQPQRDIADVQIDKALRGKDRSIIEQTTALKDRFYEEVKPEEKGFSGRADDFGKTLSKEDVVELDRLMKEEQERYNTEPDPQKKMFIGTAIQGMREAIETKQGKAPKISKPKKVEEPVTDLDLQTGTREPIELSTENSPFREKSEKTNFLLERLGPLEKLDDPHSILTRLTSEVNAWLDGREEFNISEAREFLSDIAIAAKEQGSGKSRVSSAFEGMSLAEIQQFGEVASEAAIWARKAERKVEPTEEIALNEAFDYIREAANELGRSRTYKDFDKAWTEVIKKVKELLGQEAVIDLNRYKMEEELSGIDTRTAKVRALGALPSYYKPTGKLKVEPGTELYSGIPVDAAAKEIIAGAKKFSSYVDRARGMKKFKPTAITRILREGINRTVIDRSGNIRRDMLKELGEEGYKIVQKMYLAKGASSRAAMMLDQMRKEIYRGLSQNERRILDKLILADRMIDIGKYKLPGKFKYPKDISSDGKVPDHAIEYSGLFESMEHLSPGQARNLRGMTKAYFEWMKKPLKDQLDAGLISEQEFKDLSSHKYRRIKLVEIFDKRYSAKIGARKRTVHDSGIEALARGRDTDLYEPSSEIMALEVFNRAYGRIMNNEANKGLLEVARKDKENPFVRVKEEKGDKIPSGWNRIFMYEEGKRKALYLSPEMSKEWITSSPEVSYRFSQFLRYASGSPVLRTFATGIEWGFAVANLPRDVMHTWYTARSYEGGKWKPIYNPNLPIFGLQIGRDLATVFSDAALKKGRYKDYINEGGGMEFLVHQGRLFQRGRHIEGPLDAAYDFLGYFGETSEIMTRLAIRERMIRKGKTPQEATFAARDYMDFGQGGGVAKALDNAFPYLNAAIQGTRGLARSFKPGSGSALSSTYKLSQLAALTTGVYIAMSKMHPETFKNLQGNIDMQNNLCLPLGDDFGFVDEKGETRYPYIKIPLDPGQKFFKTFFEACADKWLGNEIDVNRVVDSLKELSPVGVGELPPTVSGALGYMTNKDFWMNEDIWRKTEKPFSWPESREEYVPGQTPQAMIDVGKFTGLSPERMKYAIEELVTSGSTWSYLLGQGYEELLGDLPESQKQQHLAMALARIPVIKRFFGVTNPYSKHARVIDEKEEEFVIKRFTENRGFDALVEGYLYEKNVKRSEVFDYARKFKDKDTYDRLVDRFKFEDAIKKLPEKSFWRRMKGLPVEAKAKVFVDRLDKASPEEERQLWNEYSIVSRAKGVLGKSFRDEVNRIRTYGETPRVQVD